MQITAAGANSLFCESGLTKRQRAYILNTNDKNVFLVQVHPNNMKETALLRDRLFFTVGDIADIFGMKRQSAWVYCSRQVKSGHFLRLKNNFYVLEETWRMAPKEKLFELANFLQVPSYISFLTALSYYEVTTQVPRDYFESASLKRSAEFSVQQAQFNYCKVKKDYYFGFEKKAGFFIAAREKAFVDAVYLYSFGKYKLDFAAVDGAKLDKKEIKRIIKVFPEKTRTITEGLCKSW